MKTYMVLANIQDDSSGEVLAITREVESEDMDLLASFMIEEAKAEGFDVSRKDFLDLFLMKNGNECPILYKHWGKEQLKGVKTSVQALLNKGILLYSKGQGYTQILYPWGFAHKRENPERKG